MQELIFSVFPNENFVDLGLPTPTVPPPETITYSTMSSPGPVC